MRLPNRTDSGAIPVAAGFTLSLALVDLLETVGAGNRSLDLGLMVAGVVAVSVFARVLAGAAIGVIAWMFDNTFLTGSDDVLHWRGAPDVRALLLLVGAGVLTALLAWSVQVRISRPRRRALLEGVVPAGAVLPRQEGVKTPVSPAKEPSRPLVTK